VAVSSSPTTVAYSPDGATLYVVRNTASDLVMIDAVTHVVSPTTIPVGANPFPLSNINSSTAAR
jgi:YVTN family beta-propeller protein